MVRRQSANQYSRRLVHRHCQPVRCCVSQRCWPVRRRCFRRHRHLFQDYLVVAGRSRWLVCFRVFERYSVFREQTADAASLIGVVGPLVPDSSKSNALFENQLRAPSPSSASHKMSVARHTVRLMFQGRTASSSSQIQNDAAVDYRRIQFIE